MASNRITKSAIDWAKFAKLVPEADRGKYLAFKSRSDGYLRRVLSYPEKPPQIDWAHYRSNITNKEVVNQLESALKALQIPYPKDTVTPSIDEQQKLAEAEYKQFCDISTAKIKEAEQLLHKFKVMIPYDEMLNEDFELTFPDWCVTRESPSIAPHPEKAPGITKEERAELAKPDPAPYAIP